MDGREHDCRIRLDIDCSLLPAKQTSIGALDFIGAIKNWLQRWTFPVHGPEEQQGLL